MALDNSKRSRTSLSLTSLSPLGSKPARAKRLRRSACSASGVKRLVGGKTKLKSSPQDQFSPRELLALGSFAKPANARRISGSVTATGLRPDNEGGFHRSNT